MTTTATVRMHLGPNTTITLCTWGDTVMKESTQRVHGLPLSGLGAPLVRETTSAMSVPDFALGSRGDALTADQFDVRNLLYSLAVRAGRRDAYHAPGATAASLLGALDGYDDVA